jgi:diaminohydroxyphosphoribosylaminopyrimidine deaminase/5-amino-6-(5-phosphoribosylamino)uracil reductase
VARHGWNRTKGTRVTTVEALVGTGEWAAVNATGRPYVVYKFAATLDGRIAAADGTSQWVTSAESRAEVHRLRAACHAVVVGSGTQQADDPHLAVRGVDNLTRQPTRVIVDTNARTPASACVLDDVAPTVIAVADDAAADHLYDTRATVVRLPRDKYGIDLRVLLAELHSRDIRCVFLEGGPTLAGSFVREHLIDRVVAYIAPALLGAGKPALVDAGITTMQDIWRLEILDVARMGPDIRLAARPAK